MTCSPRFRSLNCLKESATPTRALGGLRRRLILTVSQAEVVDGVRLFAISSGMVRNVPRLAVRLWLPPPQPAAAGLPTKQGDE